MTSPTKDCGRIECAFAYQRKLAAIAALADTQLEDRPLTTMMADF
jgi:hypothetical protein